ncbi:hypothetical protein BKA70DRAFT_114974 [Coprinopsis sp. MPI-PUGE-AT-0042]|nr:hypothetical protein BKA70DRAFT_114974 [Coprinopsis sp. MPI-PUGE-AT-0042]
MSMSRASTHIEAIMASSTYSVRLRGAEDQRQPQPLLSPVGGLPFAPWVDAYPSQPPPVPSPRDYFHRSQGPPPMERQQTIPLPRIPSGLVNPLLERAPIPMIVWDLTQAPTQVTLDGRRRSAFCRSLEETATNPATTSLTIRAPFTDKPIVVHRGGAMITVRDVLVTVHLALKQAVHEQSIIQPASYLFAPSNNVFVPDSGDHALLASMLGSRSQWAGLSPSPIEQDVWVLHIK